MMYKIQLEMGDTSSDGHEKKETVYFESNYPRDRIFQAYKQSVKSTGIDLTALVAAEYQESYITRKLYDELISFGMTNIFNEVDECEEPEDDADSQDVTFYLESENYVALYIEFVKISLPDLIMKEVALDFAYIDIGGYGLFD